MSISVDDIKKLREQSGAGVKDCKDALTEASGNIEQALILLRKMGLAEIKQRASKATSEGTVGYYIHAGGKIGVLVEVNCETDFVAKGDAFKKFAHDLAMHVAALNPLWVTPDEVPADVIEREKDIIAGTLKNKPPAVVEKIVEGKLQKFYKETCLIKQQFVRDSNLTIEDLLGELASKVNENIIIKRFSRFSVGE